MNGTSNWSQLWEVNSRFASLKSLSWWSALRRSNSPVCNVHILSDANPPPGLAVDLPLSLWESLSHTLLPWNILFLMFFSNFHLKFFLILKVFLHLQRHIFLVFFLVWFSFFLPGAPEIQENHEHQWITMENHQNKGKLRKLKIEISKNEKQ